MSDSQDALRYAINQVIENYKPKPKDGKIYSKSGRIEESGEEYIFDNGSKIYFRSHDTVNSIYDQLRNDWIQRNPKFETAKFIKVKELLTKSAEDAVRVDNILFFDTETTGLPKNYKGSMFDVDNWPRVFQFAWMLCDKDGNEIERSKSLVIPEGWVVPQEKFWIERGYNTETCINEGIYMSFLLDEFINKLEVSETLVAHNMSFDYNIIGAEMIRYGKRGKKVNKLCTKELGTDFCKLEDKYGYKWPTLTELHKKLFNKEFDDAHDAMGDVVALKNCFFELIRLNVIQL